MSFLQSLAQKAAENKVENKEKVNPFAAFKKKMEEAASAKDKTDEIVKAIEEEPIKELTEKPVVEETVMDVDTVEVETENFDSAETEEEKSEEAPTEEALAEEVKEDIKAEETANTEAKEPVEDTSKEDTKDEEETVAEEPAPKTRKRRKRKTTKATENSEDETATASEEMIQIFNDEINADETTRHLLTYFTDDSWKEKEEYFMERLKSIQLSGDMNPATLKYTLSDLSILRDEVFPHYMEQKKLVELLLHKDFGAVYAFRAANSFGSNAEDRKRNGMIALMNAEVGGEKVNYIELVAVVKMRFTALEEIMNSIEYKSNICITMNGAMKMEQALG